MLRTTLERMRGKAAVRALLPFLLLPGFGAAAVERPNLLVLVADDVGWVDLGTGRTNLGNGSRFHETPNLARLAAEGMSFTAAYAQQNCAPTRASLLTGQYPTRHAVYNVGGLMAVSPAVRKSAPIAPPRVNRKDIRPSAVTLAETLGKAGYRSVVVGKEHGFGPQRELTASHGFDVDLSQSKRHTVKSEGEERTVHYMAIAGPKGRWHFVRPSFDAYARPYTREYVQANLAPFANGNDPLRLVGTPKHLTDAIADATIDQIAHFSAKQEPFFLLVGFHAVHTPPVARPDLLAKYDAREKSDSRHRDPAYAALLEGLDQSVGRIVAALDDPDGDGDPADSIAGTTLVVFLSDNGGFTHKTSNAPLRGGKGTFFEGGLRVPMIARQPGVIAADSRSDEPVHVVDLYPTFMEMAGAPAPASATHPLDGVSLLPLLRGEAPNLSRPALFWHFPGYSRKSLEPSSVINRRHAGKRYKLTWLYEAERYTLFDLSTDPGEETDLMKSLPTPEQQEAGELLSRELREWVIQTGAPLGLWRTAIRPVEPPLRLVVPRRRHPEAEGQ